MKTIEHKISLISHSKFGSKLPPHACAGILTAVESLTLQSILMAFVGRSTIQGPKPRWLREAADIRFTGIGGKTDSILNFEAPVLGDALKNLYIQEEFWPTKPDERKTGIDLLCESLADIGSDNRDSELFDANLLNRIFKMRKLLNGSFEEIQVCGQYFSDISPVILNENTIQTAERIYNETPKPQRVRLAGKLDMIRGSSRSFAIKTDDNQEIRGIFTEGDMAQLAPLFQKRILVLGYAIFRPSGKLLRIDADNVSLGESESSLWSKTPLPSNRKMNYKDLHKSQGPKSGISSIIGKWPGDETEEEIQEYLEKIS